MSSVAIPAPLARYVFRNRQLLTALTLIGGLIVLFYGFSITEGKPIPEAKLAYESALTWSSIITAFMVLSGSLQLFRYHIPIVIRKERHWSVNALAMVMALLMLGLCIAYGGVAGNPFTDKVLYRGIIRVVATAMTAAQTWISIGVLLRYTGFRSADLAAFVISILVVIIFYTPLLSAFIAPLYSAAVWVRMNVGGPATTIYQAGMTIGLIIVSMRILIGHERGILGRE